MNSIEPVYLEGWLRCWNFSNSSESGTNGGGWIAIWRDRLQLEAHRTAIVPKERVLRVRQLKFQHPVYRLMSKITPARGLETINIMVAHPPGEEYSGEIHYELAFRQPSITEGLRTFERFGYPVDWTPRVLRSYIYISDLSMDSVTKPG